MKIALFHDTRGGSKRALYEQTSRLVERGHTFDLYSFTWTEEQWWDVRPLAKETFRTSPRILSPRLLGLLRLARLPGTAIELIDYLAIARACAHLAKTVNARAYDVVFTHQCSHTSTPPLLTQLRIPTVHFCQEPLRRLFEAIGSDLDVEPVNRADWRQRHVGPLILASLERRALAAASRLLVNSTYSREYLAHVYNIPSSVCYLGVDPDRFRPAGHPRERIVLSVGALSPHKGHGFVVRALATLPERSRPKLVVVADRGPQSIAERLRHAAGRLGVDIEIRCDVSDEELVGWYTRAAVLACGQVLEPFGLVALEAMACEMPVVAVREGGFRETVIDGETGSLSDRDTAEFGERIARLLDDAEARTRLGRAGREWVLERWTWEHSVCALERQLCAAANGHAARHRSASVSCTS